MLSDIHRTKIAGMVWMCAAQFFAAQGVAQSRWRTPFSLTKNYISDLGNTKCDFYPPDSGSYVCSPWHALMNASFVAQGLIILAGAILLRPVFANRRGSFALFLLLVVTGLGIIGVGLYPENENNRAHVLCAGVQFITSNAALILCGVCSAREKRWRTFATVSIALGVTGLLATMLFPSGIGFGLGIGGMERVAAYTLPVWLMAAGTLMLRKPTLYLRAE